MNQETQIKYAQLSQQQAEIRSKMVSECKYNLHLEIDDQQISGLIVITFNSNSKNVVIDFCGKQITSIEVNERKWTVEEILLNWKKHQITFNECQEENSVVIRFCSQYSDNGFGVYKQQSSETYIYSLFCPNYAHSCFPCFDQPSIKAEISLDVISPADWTVISNMNGLFENIDEFKKHWRFAPTPKISTYLFSLNAGNWQHNQILLENGNYMHLYCESIKRAFLIRQQCNKFRNLHLIKQCMDFGIRYYESIFQIPLPFQKQDIIFCSNFYFSGMEHPGAILASQNLLNKQPTRTSFLLLLLHELSHMWFGNLVTMQWWNDLWLNEAFAVFISYKALEEYVKNSLQEHEDPIVHYLLYKQNGVLQDINPMTHPIDVEIQDANEGLQAFDSITYNKGSAVLCALVNQIGFQQFIAIIQTFLKKYSWSNATTNDLFALIYKETNAIDIKRWKEEYIESNGISIIWLRRQNDKIFIEQRDFHQVNKPRQHLIKILILQNDEQIHLEVQLSQASQLLEISFDAAILNYDDSSYCLSIIDEHSLHYLQKNFKFLEITTNIKIQVLNSLFEMSYILGTLNVQEYIKFVLDQVDQNVNKEILNFIVQKLIIIYEKLSIKHKVKFGEIIFARLQPFIQCSFVADNIGLFACTPEHIHQLYIEIENQGQQSNLQMVGKFLSCLFYRSYLMDQTLIADYEKIWEQLKPYNAHLARQQKASLMNLTEMQEFFDNLLQFNVHDLEDILKGLNNEYSINYLDYENIYLTYLPLLIQSEDQHMIRVLLNTGFPNQGDVAKQLEILDEVLQNHYNLQLTITKLQQTLLQRRAIQQQCQ